MLTSLDHIVIGVRDLDASTARLSSLLGRKPSWRGRHAAYGTANTLFRLDKTYVELLSPLGDGTLGGVVRDSLERHGDGLLALAFGTSDASAAASELRARGLAAAEPVAGSGRESSSGVERGWRNVWLPIEETRGVWLFVIEHVSPPDRLPFAVATEDDGAAVSGVDHVVVHSTDPDGARTLYGEKLGIRLALDKSFPDWGMRLLFFRVGGITVEIAAPLAAATETTDRLWGISYQVPDVERAVARLRRDGFDAYEARAGRKPGTSVATVRGEPCGVATLLIEPAPR
jgi:catechol 2,3-dioxygenase-like lactoylglutathione lyase family enzyme